MLLAVVEQECLDAPAVYLEIAVISRGASAHFQVPSRRVVRAALRLQARPLGGPFLRKAARLREKKDGGGRSSSTLDHVVTR